MKHEQTPAAWMVTVSSLVSFGHVFVEDHLYPLHQIGASFVVEVKNETR